MWDVPCWLAASGMFWMHSVSSALLWFHSSFVVFAGLSQCSAKLTGLNQCAGFIHSVCCSLKWLSVCAVPCFDSVFSAVPGLIQCVVFSPVWFSMLCCSLVWDRILGCSWSHSKFVVFIGGCCAASGLIQCRFIQQICHWEWMTVVEDCGCSLHQCNLWFYEPQNGQPSASFPPGKQCHPIPSPFIIQGLQTCQHPCASSPM